VDNDGRHVGGESDHHHRIDHPPVDRHHRVLGDRKRSQRRRAFLTESISNNDSGWSPRPLQSGEMVKITYSPSGSSRTVNARGGRRRDAELHAVTHPSNRTCLPVRAFVPSSATEVRRPTVKQPHIKLSRK